VTRYDRLDDPIEAEVAFVVEDAHQGRGLGSVLLEHLAATAWERGIRRFVAEVLPMNRRMIRVFHDAGFSTTSEYDQDVVHLSFPIEPTPTSLSVLRVREHQAEARSVGRLLRPAAVAVVGVSRDEHSVGRALLAHMVEADFAGTLAAVNPAAGGARIGGVESYASVLDLPGTVDLAVLAVPAAAVPEVVGQCAEKGVRALVVVSAGFAEAGPEGERSERALVELAHANGMRVVGPNCLGVLNTDPDVRLNASLAPHLPPRGRVGLFAQSGALGIGVLQSLVGRGLGLSSFVSAGNRADVSGNDLLQYWEDDEGTDLVLMYLESMGNPRKFARISRRIARRKPIVVVKSRRSWRELGAVPGVAAPALDDEAVDALFRQAGVIRVATVDELLDAALVLAYQPLPAGRRVGIVGNSTALVGLAADACAAEGLIVAGTPIGVEVTSGSAEFAAALSAVLVDESVDAVVTVFVPPLLVPDDDVARVLVEGARDSAKPVVSVFLGFNGVPPSLQRSSPPGEAPGRGSIPSFGSPEPAVRALARAISYSEWRRRPEGVVPDLTGIQTDEARALVDGWLAGQPAGGLLSDGQAAELLAHYGVAAWPTERVRSADEAVAAADRLGYPVAVKATEAALRHRADLGGVRLNLATAGEVATAYAAMGAATGAAAASALVQRMAPPGVATVVSTAEHPSFGPVLSFGIAGVATDLLGDRAHRILPLTDRDAADLVRSVRAAPMLFGHRGTDPVDTAALEELLLRLGRLADELPAVAELVLNPVVVGTDGCYVLATEIRLGSPRARGDVGPRRLR